MKQAGRTEVEVQQSAGHAEFGERQQSPDKPWFVLYQQGHRVALLHPAVASDVRQAVGLPVHLAVAVTDVLVDEERLVRGGAGVSLEVVHDGERHLPLGAAAEMTGHPGLVDDEAEVAVEPRVQGLEDENGPYDQEGDRQRDDGVDHGETPIRRLLRTKKTKYVF